MVQKVPPIRKAEPHHVVQVYFPNGQTYEGPANTPLIEFIQVAYPAAPYPIMVALVEGDLRELTNPVDRDVHVTPIDTSTNDGMRVYQRSLSFVFIVALHELYPDARVLIDHSVTYGGFFCEIVGRKALSAQEIKAVEARMREIVAADEPILKKRMPVDEAREMFAAQGYEDKVRLLAYRQQPEIAVYVLRGVCDFFYGHMAPSTGHLRWFELQPYSPGIILRMPTRKQPTSLPPHADYPKLMKVFLNYGRWMSILGLEDIGSLNEAIDAKRIQEIILVEEALHEKRIADIADEVAKDHRTRLVLIAGPSSSGKTTFARRLAIQLLVNGLKPFALGLDDYFVDRELTPRDEQGEYDFEALEAIDLSLFNEQLVALMAGEPVQLPHYDFKTGQRGTREEISLSQDAVLIVEGIHGLNPNLIRNLPRENVFRIYVSALTQLNIDHHNRVPTTDTRLLRRIVRDASSRGYSARETIERWESVRRGEERNIFPYQENADVMFNSALTYELAVLKPFVEPLLLRVPRGTMESIEARRLLAFLQWVRPCEAALVPDNSLLREFIGGSILSEFKF